jgi:hypothetical protein
MNQFAQKNNDFWSKIPHSIYDHWCGSRASYLKIIHKLSSRVNRDGEVHFSARKLANEVGVDVSSVSRFLVKGRIMGLWVYKFDMQKNKSFLKFVGGIFANIYTQAQHLVKASQGMKERFFPRRTNPIRLNATPTQHLTQQPPPDPVKRAKVLEIVRRSIEIADQKWQASFMNATPSATQI